MAFAGFSLGDLGKGARTVEFRSASISSLAKSGRFSGEGVFRMAFAWSINTTALNRRIDAAEVKGWRESAKAVQREAKNLLKVKRSTALERTSWRRGQITGSLPGEVPAYLTRNLKSSIKYSVKKKQGAWIGATRQRGPHGRLMRWGTKERSGPRGKVLPRPFMEPALQNVLPTLSPKWQNLL